MSPDPIALWHRAVETRDLSVIDELIAEDAVFHSPVLGRPQEGKALVAKYLRAAMAVLNNPSFRYVGEWRAERSAVLEFELLLGETRVNGVDLIWWNAAGQITLFKVMIRPLRAINALMPLMAAELGAPAA